MVIVMDKTMNTIDADTHPDHPDNHDHHIAEKHNANNVP